MDLGKKVFLLAALTACLQLTTAFSIPPPPAPEPAFPGGEWVLGGFGDWEEPNENIEKVCKDIRESVEDLMEPFESFIPVTYKSQVVAGWNYEIKVDVGKDQFLVISVYKDFNDVSELTDYQWDFEDMVIVEPPEEMHCPFNQIWQECGTACPNKCGEEEPFICTMNCVIGCQCPPGQWEDVDGSCVEDDSLCTASGKEKNECESNKVWQECGTACPLKCGEEAPMICTMNCVIGCQCPPGHWEDVDGSCVEDNSMCIPMPLEDACATNPCDEECFCQNAPEMDDGYDCACPIVDPFPVPDPYPLPEIEDMDPCEQQGLLCHPDAHCMEFFMGGWQCMCNDGLVGDGQQDCEEPPMKINGK